ncbi:hypothetical protein WICMUC_002089 [Wickerhamomyces mucosus]|uniref:Gfd2/YDR514C-like C-terminal domain-containing protein n=1 Tax=Wickerhamomyces mucosus TaxID=1378264 RepID=A0A9P8TE81_9ASCO|nr:hypothetical protein WICMUC_002089 [Wickerhamomyces mucosus]
MYLSDLSRSPSPQPVRIGLIRVSPYTPNDSSTVASHFTNTIAPDTRKYEMDPDDILNLFFDPPPKVKNDYLRSVSNPKSLARRKKERNQYRAFNIDQEYLFNLSQNYKVFLSHQLELIMRKEFIKKSPTYINLTSKRSKFDKSNNRPDHQLFDFLNGIDRQSIFTAYERLFKTFQSGKGLNKYEKEINEACIIREVDNFKLQYFGDFAPIASSLEIELHKNPKLRNQAAIDDYTDALVFYLTKGGKLTISGEAPIFLLNRKYESDNLDYVNVHEQRKIQHYKALHNVHRATNSEQLIEIRSQYLFDETVMNRINGRFINDLSGYSENPNVYPEEQKEEPRTEYVLGFTHTTLPPETTSFRPIYNHRLQFPSLESIIPDVDKSFYDIDFLERLTNSKRDILEDYLEDVNANRGRHEKLQNNDIFGNLKRHLRTGNSYMDTFISIDIEAFELENSKITEIGVSIYDPLKEATSMFPNFINIHILVKDYLHLRNGRFVEDNKDKFLCGSSVILTKDESLKFIQAIIDHYCIRRYEKFGMNGILVGHNVPGDIKWLKQLGIHFPRNVKTLDTQIIFNLTNKSLSLGKILRMLNVPHSFLHNAGNDAYFTLSLLLKLLDVNFRKINGIDEVSKQFSNDPEPYQVFNDGFSGDFNKKSQKKPSKCFQFTHHSQFSRFQDALYHTYGYY